MNATFLRFKRGLLTVNIVKSLLLGLSLGLAAGGALLLLTNYEIITLSQIYILPIAIGVLLLAGVGTYFLIRSSDKRTAAGLDKRYSLEERVQTMLQYKDEQGAIYELQRKDAEEALSAAKTASFTLRGLWIYILSFVLGAAVLTSGIIFKPEPPPPPPEIEVPFSLSEIQIKAIEGLITYVEGSEMSSPYRENTASHLSAMLGELKAATTTKMRDAAVTRANNAILQEIDDSSSGLEIINALGSSFDPTVLAFARALNFYDWTVGNEWDSYTNAITKFRGSLSAALSEEEAAGKGAAELQAARLKQLLTASASTVASALQKSGINASDAFYIAAASYLSYLPEDGSDARGIALLAEIVGELGYDKSEERLDLLFAALNNPTFTALEADYNNVYVGEYAIVRVCTLLGVSIPRFERPIINRDPEEDSGGGAGSESSGGGGIGVGTVYGSNDIVLDPMTGEFVEYGTILDDYFYLDAKPKIDGGTYTEEEKKALEKYYDILYNGFDNKGDTNNE